MSARAAARLRTLGFEEVYRYQPGKADWAAAGLPMEGAGVGVRAGDLAGEAQTCTLDDDLGEVRKRAQGTCVVLSAEGVVLGRLGREALAAADDRTVEEAMTEGPGTIRPDRPLDWVLERMRARNLSELLVTNADGKLVGVVRREDAEAAARRPERR